MEFLQAEAPLDTRQPTTRVMANKWLNSDGTVLAQAIALRGHANIEH
jgi:hypothetical protein